MFIKENRVKLKLRAGQPAYGVISTTDDPQLAEQLIDLPRRTSEAGEPQDRPDPTIGIEVRLLGQAPSEAFTHDPGDRLAAPARSAGHHPVLVVGHDHLKSLAHAMSMHTLHW